MSKNKKGIQDNTVIKTMPDLLARVDEELEKQLAARRKREAGNRESLNAAAQKERDILEKIGKAREIANKLIAEFQQLERTAEKEARERMTKDVIREQDVTSGKVKLKEFQKKGITEKKISEQVIAQSTNELSRSLKVIREKNLEILQLEDSLGECRNTIRGLSVQPGRFMLDFLKNIREFAEDETGAFMAELDGYRTEWDQVKQAILLTQGKSMSGRYVWDSLSMDEARALQFSPLLPLSCVEKLKSELEKYEGSDGISLTLYVRLGDVEITSISPRQSGVIQTIEVKEDKQDGTKFTREKAGH